MAAPDDIPIPVERAHIEKDETSEREDDTLLSSEKTKGKRLQIQRRSDFKGHVHWVSVGFLWFGAACYALAIVIWLMHLIGTDCLRYLPDENITKLQSMLFGSFAGVVVSHFAHKIFGEK